jgi:hypothetical protein
MSPFISVSRKARRRPSQPVVAVALVAGLLFVTGAVPAVGGPQAFSSAVSTRSIAKKALALAKKADKHAKTSSVGSKRLVNGAVIADKIANGAVGTFKITPGAVGPDRLADGAVTSAKIADGAVTGAKIGDGAVAGAKVADGAISTKKLAGADVSGAIDLAVVPANSCELSEANVPGAVVGQFPIVAFYGDTPLPSNVTVQAIKVAAPNTVRLKICNPTNSASSAATGIGTRVITLG